MSLFSGWSTEKIDQLLQKLEEVDFEPGEVLMEIGELGDEFFLVVDGNAYHFMPALVGPSKNQQFCPKNYDINSKLPLAKHTCTPRCISKQLVLSWHSKRATLV